MRLLSRAISASIPFIGGFCQETLVFIRHTIQTAGGLIHFDAMVDTPAYNTLCYGPQVLDIKRTYHFVTDYI